MSRSRCWPTGTATRVWLGSRDCSLQRRHQKVLEEAPAPGLPPELVAEIGERCAEACRQIGYQGVGTFEFLVEDGVFSFIEMNTRVQVEHPVTEMTTGIDIVARGHPGRAGRGADLHAGGRRLPRARLRVPDQRRGPGDLRAVARPRHPLGDAGRPRRPGRQPLAAGGGVPPYYDSLIAKLIVHGATREEALARLRVALDEARVEGIATNLPLHRRIVADPGFAAGRRRHPPPGDGCSKGART